MVADPYGGGVTRYFSLEEASALLPEARRRIAEVAALTADLHRLAADIRDRGGAAPGEIPEVKSLEARIDDKLGWFREHGVQVKGVAPALLDFPMQVGGEEVLVCWLQGEDEIAWYHPTELGFVGRRPLADLDEEPG